jgi:hypothetical protein
MTIYNTFKYVDNDSAEEARADSLAAIVPPGITNTQQLLKILFERLKLPSYFGFNWNALEECLRDFHWINEHNVILIHKDLPVLIHTDTKIYLDVLDECVRHWRAKEGHNLEVIFPKAYRPEIERISNE